MTSSQHRNDVDANWAKQLDVALVEFEHHKSIAWKVTEMEKVGPLIAMRSQNVRQWCSKG